MITSKLILIILKLHVPGEKNSPLLLTNYHPISLLPIFNQLLEKLVCKRLINYLEKIHILHNNQFRFRSNHSTLHALLTITDKIQRSIDSGNFSCGIFLDLSKAFDTVNHKILLYKLEHYGIQGKDVKLVQIILI